MGIALLFYVFYGRLGADPRGETMATASGMDQSRKETVSLRDIFYAEGKYNEAMLGLDKVEKKADAAAIIVPHHLVASDMIARQIAAAKGREISQVVVIGPNHENIGGDALSALNADWETPFGPLRSSDALARKFMADFNIHSDLEVFENEHAIGGLAPFVRDILGDVEFLPIAVSSYADFNDLLKLAGWLDQNLPADALIIYSIDFSHYLTKEAAAQNDKLSREIIMHQDVEAALKLDNDFVDSPFILALSLWQARNKGLDTVINENANSYDYASVKPVETTSYFTVSFHQTTRARQGR